jgi:hypothetical protein
LTSQDAVLTVQLQDINGYPALAQQATSVIVTASNTTLFPAAITLNIPAGADYATTLISTKSFGKASLTASSPGLGTSRITLTVLNSPVTTRLTASQYSFYDNESATLFLNVTALSRGLPGVNVSWLTTAGSLSSPNSTTGPNGIATVVFSSSAAAVAKVTAVFNSPFTGAKNLSATIYVFAIPKPAAQTFSQEIGPYVIYIVIIIVVAVAIVGFFFYRRWRRNKAPTSAAEEETEPYDELEGPPEDPTGEVGAEEGGSGGPNNSLGLGAGGFPY